MIEKEQWRDIDGYVGRYQISNERRLKSLSRTVKTFSGWKRTRPDTIMFNGATDKKTVCLYDHNGIRRTHNVDVLFAKAFQNEVKE